MQGTFAGIVRTGAAFFAAGFITQAVAADATVPYVPTPQVVVDRMLQMAKVTPLDYVIDLGSGDGRIVITAAKKYGARGFGVDLNPVRIKEATENAAKAGVSDRVTFYQRNLFETDFSQATVMTMYLLPRVNLDLRPKILALKPGTRVVSHDFSMDEWKADEQVDIDAEDKYGPGSGKGLSTVFLWIVPANAAGNWQWQTTIGGKPQTYEMTLEQKFQVVTGSVRVNGRSSKFDAIKLVGDLFTATFVADVNGGAVKHQLTGRIAGGAIDGSVTVAGARMQSESEWNAARKP